MLALQERRHRIGILAQRDPDDVSVGVAAANDTVQRQEIAGGHQAESRQERVVAWVGVDEGHHDAFRFAVRVSNCCAAR